MDPVNFWLVFLFGAMSASPFMVMFGAAVKQRQVEDERAQMRLAERMANGYAEDR